MNQTAQLDNVIESLEYAEFFIRDVLDRNKALDIFELDIKIKKQILQGILNRVKKPIYLKYTKEIEAFFKGELRDMLFANKAGSEYYSGHSKKKGHVWISEHETFDTLTVEPIEGGQYEIAVRIKNEESDNEYYKYPGYCVADPHGSLAGFGTRGH
jgi:hypothetical protein